MSSKREKKAREAKEAIFTAAAKVVGRVGYAKATMAATKASSSGIRLSWICDISR